MAGADGVLTKPFNYALLLSHIRSLTRSKMLFDELRLREGTSQSGSRILSSDPVERRRAMKELFFRLPARPWLKFFYYYLCRRGFLDGKAGLTYATLQAMYEYQIDCKYHELLRRKQGLPV